MKIESLRVKNFRVFHEVHIRNIPSLSVFVGANGSGKSTFFDIFGFLHDALLHNVSQALAKRGGFREVISRGQLGKGPIEFEIKFRDTKDSKSKKEPLVTYELFIDIDEFNKPRICRERLQYRRGQYGAPWRFLDFTDGSGSAVRNEEQYGQPNIQEDRDFQTLESKDILAIKGLGQFQKFKMISSFRNLIEKWHVSDFHISDARASQDVAYAEHLSTLGENLPNVAQFLFENYKDLFNEVLQKMSKRVPGVKEVEATQTHDGRVVLRFQDGSFKDPFIARYVSDGTIKMFAYLILLYDPNPHPLLCVEEPENQLYPSLLLQLAEEFREYTLRGGQVMISSHSPDFLNGIDLNEIFLLSKQKGFTSITRASADETLVNLVRQGDLPGYLWNQGFFKGVSP
jgi:predicted ATPase